MNVLYEDNCIVVAVKPAGLISEIAEKGSFPATLREELIKTRPDNITLHTIHRLDKDTEGIMVYALSPSSAAQLSAQIANGEWKKTYTALLCGIPENKSDRLCDLLFYDRNRGKSFVVERQRKGVKEAILDYEVIATDPEKNLCAVKIELQTGRTHQIRVQFASRGLCLIGDRRYGAPAKYGNDLALCATELCFKHPETNEPMRFNISPSFELPN